MGSYHLRTAWCWIRARPFCRVLPAPSWLSVRVISRGKSSCESVSQSSHSSGSFSNALIPYPFPCFQGSKSFWKKFVFGEKVKTENSQNRSWLWIKTESRPLANQQLHLDAHALATPLVLAKRETRTLKYQSDISADSGNGQSRNPIAWVIPWLKAFCYSDRTTQFWEKLFIRTF